MAITQKLNYRILIIILSVLLIGVAGAFIYIQVSKQGETMPPTAPVDAPLALTDEYRSAVIQEIEANINQLSPQEAVLGGTFYVTEIEFIGDNQVLVDYEDGHIALEGIAEYKLLPNNAVQIESFSLAESESVGTTINFTEIGNLTKAGDEWQLVYEEPGAPALTVKLVFGDWSVCADEYLDRSCEPVYWEVGARAEVSGEKAGDVVRVYNLRIVGENSQVINGGNDSSTINSFDECVDAGYEPLYPDCQGCNPYCETDDGQRFELSEQPEDDNLCVDNCGNGICEEIVCLGTGCPCAETPESCPQDCN